jgi:hypothetical protein
MLLHGRSGNHYHQTFLKAAAEDDVPVSGEGSDWAFAGHGCSAAGCGFEALKPVNQLR